MILTKTAQFDLKFLACVASAIFFQDEERNFEDARTKIARSDNKTAQKSPIHKSSQSFVSILLLRHKRKCRFSVE